MRAALVIAALATACSSGSSSSDGAGGAPREASPDAALITVEGGAETAPDKLAAEPSLPTEVGEPPEMVDLDQGVERLGAIPAWQAVIDRDQYLLRRGQSAVVFGRIGGALPGAVLPDAGVIASDQVWLVDETEGNGALAIRVRFGGLAIEPGARVAVAGAWEPDDQRRWVWKATAVTALPPGEPAAVSDPPSPPGLTVVAADPPGPRSKVRMPAVVNDGELMEFTVTAPPPRTGDGWSISDRRWGELMAFLVLPGERDSFGGHDLRHADERWPLKKGATYWVRVAKVRRREGKTTVIIAATPPVRFP